MKPNTKKDTKSAIMNSAEILMAEHGIDGVSLREILRNADANPAALVYHFNSKDGLIAAILERHGPAIDARRLELLRTLESVDTPPTVVEVIDALIDPLLEFLHEEGESGRRFLRFLARLRSDRTGIIQQTEEGVPPEWMLRLRRVITTACSHLSKQERMRRFGMVMDAMLQSLANASVMSKDWKGNDYAADLDGYASTLKRFLSGGLAAPE